MAYLQHVFLLTWCKNEHEAFQTISCNYKGSNAKKERGAERREGAVIQKNYLAYCELTVPVLLQVYHNNCFSHIYTMIRRHNQVGNSIVGWGK